METKVKELSKWKSEYIQPLFDKYSSVPNDVKYSFIEKDYVKMGGKKWALDQMRYMYSDSETFIIAFDNALCEFSDRVIKNIIQKLGYSIDCEWVKIIL